MGVEVDGPYEARKAARQQLKEGADLLKMLATGGVYGLRHDEPWSPQLELDELQAAVAEARKAHRVAAIHAEGEQGIATAIEAGADTIEHGNQLTRELAEKMAKQRHLPGADPGLVLQRGRGRAWPDLRRRVRPQGPHDG